jgi:molybdenum cofactor cytidylyltransferase
MAECPSITVIFVEADGARGLPFKAPAEHEPVIPDKTTVVIPVIGSDIFEGSVRETVHRPERAAALLSPSGEKPVSLDSRLTPALAARLITHPRGSMKDVPPGAAVIPFINKCETPGRTQSARALAEELLADPRIDHVVMGALKSLPDSVTLAVR